MGIEKTCCHIHANLPLSYITFMFKQYCLNYFTNSNLKEAL